MIKAVIFDFDGTMTNRPANAYGVFETYLKPFFKDMNDTEYEAVLQDMMIFDCNGTISTRLRLIPFIDKYKDYLPDDFEDNFIRYYYEHMFEHTALKPETVEVLETLRKDYKVALLSNGYADSQHAKIDHVDIEKYFDEVIVTGDYGIHKPDPRIFEIMAEKLGVKCEECMMVGDVFSTDILGARNANMTPVWIILDDERPAIYYDGYRINNLNEIYEILEKENNQ